MYQNKAKYMAYDSKTVTVGHLIIYHVHITMNIRYIRRSDAHYECRVDFELNTTARARRDYSAFEIYILDTFSRVATIFF